MTNFNKIIATASLFVACNVQVAFAAEAAPVIETAAATISKQAIVSSTLRSKLTEVGKWCSTKSAAVTKATKDFETESLNIIETNKKAITIAVATVVVAGVCYAIYKRNQARKAAACDCNA